MKPTPFVPEDFLPPEKVTTKDFILKKLCFADAKLDYEAVMSSIDIIHQVRGGSWPTSDLTFEDDQIDLAWHQREFEFKNSFAYTVLSRDEGKCLGCVYFYPLNKPWIKAPEGSDVVVNFWVTQEAYDQGLYPKLYFFMQDWVKQAWPFKNPFFSNKEVPQK